LSAMSVKESIPGKAVLRMMEENDIPDCLRIEALREFDGWSENAIASSLTREEAAFFCAGDENGVYGFCGFYMSMDEAELVNISVHPELRGKGIGRFLLTGSMEELEKRGVKTFFLEVRSSNENAIALYRSLGFREVGARRGFYRNPSEDALVMRAEGRSNEGLLLQQSPGGGE